MGSVNMLKPKLLDQVRQALRLKHYSLRTKKLTFTGSRALSFTITSATPAL